MWFLRYASGQTDRQTDMLITILCTHNISEKEIFKRLCVKYNGLQLLGHHKKWAYKKI